MYLTRREEYDKVLSMLESLKKHGKQKGDVVQVDKCRKLQLAVTKLRRDDQSEEVH